MRHVNSIINRLLRSSGLELCARGRTVADLKSYPQLATSGWIVEIIGTQAIGKSTLNNAIYKSLRPRWFFRHDLQFTGPTSIRSNDIEKLHRDILHRRIGHISRSQLDAWKSLTISRQTAVVLYESLTIMSNTFARGFMLDESLVKNFPHEVLELSPEAAAPLWKNRAFIYLRARNIDVAVSRYQGRVAKRRERGIFQHPQTDDEVCSRVEKDNLLFDQVREKAQSSGCPTLTVYAEDDLKGTVENVLGFEKSLSAVNSRATRQPHSSPAVT